MARPYSLHYAALLLTNTAERLRVYLEAKPERLTDEEITVLRVCILLSHAASRQERVGAAFARVSTEADIHEATLKPRHT